MKKIAIAFVSLLFLVCAGCATHNSNRDWIASIPEKPAKKYSNYSFDPDTPVLSRIYDTPDFLLTYLREMDKTDAYISYSPTDAERDQFEEYFKKLPPANQKVMKEKLIGIYFVENFIGSAMADYVLDEEKNLYNILIINPEVMKHTMSDWLTYRENSCFQQDREYEVQVDCGKDYTGLLYTLLHESTHLVDYQNSITPFTEYTSFVLTGEDFDRNNIFYKEIWKEYSTPRKCYIKDFTGKVSFYGLSGEPELKISDSRLIYDELMTTPFASLYGSMSWAEDLAELVTWDYYTRILKMPYSIKLYFIEELIEEYRPMDNTLVQKRSAITDSFY